MKSIRRIVPLLLALAMLGGVLAGFGTSDDPVSATSTQSPTTGADTPTEKQESATQDQAETDPLPTTPSEGLEYALAEDGSHYIVAGVGTCKNQVVVIPAEHEGKPVTEIGVSAFTCCEAITRIVLPDTVTRICAEAFMGCTGLEKINIPDGVTDIDDQVFAACYSLSEIRIPDGVTRIGDSAFFSCWSLTSLLIPSSVTSIEGGAFTRCPSLESITVEKGNTVYHSDGNCLIETASKTLIKGCDNSVIATDGSVTSIGAEAFEMCGQLTELRIPEGVTSIDNSAFQICPSLTSIWIPASVTSLGSDVFTNCSALTSIVVESGNPVYHSAGNCLIETESKTMILGCADSMIPDDGSVVKISGAFCLCSNLTKIKIPDGVQELTNMAFSSCEGLTSVELPYGVTQIGYQVFSECTGLTSVTIPSSVETIEVLAFAACTALTDIYFQGTEEQWHAISKGKGWDVEIPSYTIHCSDGRISK